MAAQSGEGSVPRSGYTQSSHRLEREHYRHKRSGPRADKAEPRVHLPLHLGLSPIGHCLDSLLTKEQCGPPGLRSLDHRD
eukprot:5044533-Amphidinium_carterae.1